MVLSLSVETARQLLNQYLINMDYSNISLLPMVVWVKLNLKNNKPSTNQYKTIHHTNQIQVKNKKVFLLKLKIKYLTN